MFNEADSLISKRINLVSSADSISNTMQNILLEELEKFNGIFFATTNMIGNIDEAFDRRFLFKLKLDLPNKESRMMIIKDKMHFLSSGEIEKLVEYYPLSGGEIDNVSKKIEIENLLNGCFPSFEETEKLFRAELAFRNKSKGKIGY